MLDNMVGKNLLSNFNIFSFSLTGMRILNLMQVNQYHNFSGYVAK